MSKQKTDKMIGFRADRKLADLLQKEADRHLVKVSWLIRYILRDYFQGKKRGK